jgi:hypothetical protein
LHFDFPECAADVAWTSGWFVDETDGCADDEPLNEVGDALIEGEHDADVEVDVVVDDEDADHKQADECAEGESGYDAAARGIDFCVENGDDHDADEDGDHAEGHDFHHAFL